MSIVAFDIETTGLDKNKDQIIQFAAIKFESKTYKVLDSINFRIQPVGSYTISIPAYFKHGIRPEMLSDCPHLEDVAQKIIDFIGDSDILTYNGNSFDIVFLENELNKYGFSIDWMSKKMYDSYIVQQENNSNTLENVYKRYKGKSMEEAGLSAHDALSDVKATISVFVAQNKQYGDINPVKVYGLDNAVKDMMFQGKMCPCMNIGKYRGLSLEFIKSIDKGYLQWAISEKSNFDKNTKEFITKYLVGK